MGYRDQRERPVTSRVAIRVDDSDGPGGDFACSLRTGTERLVCVVGDVTGHGRQAARFRVELASRVTALARAGARPAAILETVNSEFERAWPSDIFACLVCIDVDLRRRRAAIAVAGHLPPIVKTPRRTRAVLVAAGAPVGTFANEHYAETAIGLEEGALVVVATDGIGDALMSEGDPMGIDALERLIRHAPHDPDALCGFVFASAIRVGGRATQSSGPRESSRLKDDATVLAVQISAGSTAGWGANLTEPGLVSAA